MELITRSLSVICGGNRDTICGRCCARKNLNMLAALNFSKTMSPHTTGHGLFSRALGTSNILGNKTAVIEANDLKVGDVIHGYKLEKVDYIKELNIKPYYLIHQATGAEHLHIHKGDDSNNLFAVSLRTTPKNSTGVAHILEHLALCGSKKYPVKDPFFEMNTRSLANFMNAMTGADFTTYPFSTQNKKDFENLLSVYIDAVFFPRLRQVNFRQEGWRLEHEVPNDKDTPMTFRGVVFNEMKGVFSSTSSIYARQLLNNLFPDTTYRYESGGDPSDIPKLSHEELKKFHQIHYHPSNAKFFTYGDFPLENHLSLINDLALSKFSENSQAREQSVVHEQTAWCEPKSVSITCPPDSMCANPEKQTTTSISYVIPTKIVNYDDMLALDILTCLLTDGPNAPFYKSLIESGIGANYSPSTGMANFTKQPYFSVGLEKISANDINKVHQIIEKTFVEVAEEGFQKERVDAILHSFELNLKHVPRNLGLLLLMNMESSWNHDGDVMDYFRFNKRIDKFKEDLAKDEKYWSKLISKYFINNKHKLYMSMNPDTSYEDNRKEREKNLLDEMVSQLSDVERQTVLYEGMELIKIQNAKNDPNILPCLEPSKDISSDLRQPTPLEFDSHKGVKIQLCEQPTNEIVYFKALCDIGAKLRAAGLLDYVPLFCSVATKLGAGAYNRQQFALKTSLKSSDLGIAGMLIPSLSEIGEYKHNLVIQSHCLKRNVTDMFELWSNVFKQIHFQDNQEYVFQLVKAMVAALSGSISYNGQGFAMKRSAAYLSSFAHMDERLNGLTIVGRMKDMAAKEKPEEIVVKLQEIAHLLLDPFSMKCSINAEPDAMKTSSDHLKQFIDKIQADSSQGQANDTERADNDDISYDYTKTKYEDMKFPFATHFVAKSLVAVPRMHEDFPKISIMCRLISSKYLLREVREKGGAYGVGASLGYSGILSFYSYRDPKTTGTLRIFDQSRGWLVDGQEYNERDVEESKLGVFRDIDRPIEPGRRGDADFTIGETDDMRRDFRKRLLAVTKKDIVTVAKKYLDTNKMGTYII